VFTRTLAVCNGATHADATAQPMDGAPLNDEDVEAMAVEMTDKAERRLAANQRNPNGDNNA
jgi:hypothetical protein